MMSRLHQVASLFSSVRHPEDDIILDFAKIFPEELFPKANVVRIGQVAKWKPLQYAHVKVQHTVMASSRSSQTFTMNFMTDFY